MEILDHYRLDAELGRGGMGVVYRAYDLILHRPVAIKILAREMDDTGRARLMTEARAAAALNHPNICVVYEVHDDPVRCYLVLEYIDGQPLSALIPATGLPPPSVVRYGLQVADALAHAHLRQLIHRDVKPGNILVTSAGLAKLLDFGIAHLLKPEECNAVQTATRTAWINERDLAGTPAYMAPEQLRGWPGDSSSDVWSVGVTLFEMVAGHRPFGGDTLADLVGAVMRQPIPALPNGTPAGLVALIERCLDRVPERRFRTAGELHAALEVLESDTSVRIHMATVTPSVAVLPFADMSPARDQGYLCEGIAEEIINALARNPEFRVAARTSAFTIGSRPAEIDIREIGQRLNVASVIEGSLRKAGERLRVTVQLIDAATGYHLWSENFDRPLQDVFAIQDEIAAAVARIFERALPSDRAAKGGGSPGNLQAYELYLQGRYLWNRRPGEVVWQALKCFETAAALDPHFAAAWAGIADIYATLGSWESGVLPHSEAQTKAHAYSQRALAIDPSLAEAHTTLAYTTLHYDWDLAAAEAGFQHSIRLNPSYAAAHHWYSHCLAAAGRSEESLSESRRALQLDPMNLVLSAHLAWHYHMARLPEQVIEQADRVVHMDQNFHWGHYFLGWGLEATRQLTKAVDAFRCAVQCSAGNPVMEAGLGRALALNGERTEALRTVGELERAGGEHCLFAYETALILLALGETSQALEWLDRAFRKRSGWIVYTEVDPRLDSARADPRFREITTQWSGRRFVQRGAPPNQALHPTAE